VSAPTAGVPLPRWDDPPPPWTVVAPPPAATRRHPRAALRCLQTQCLRDGTRVALPRSLRWPMAVSMPTSERATPSATGWSTGWCASTSPRSSSASRRAGARCRGTSRRSSRPSCAAGCSRAGSCERGARGAGTTGWWRSRARAVPGRLWSDHAISPRLTLSEAKGAPAHVSIALPIVADVGRDVGD